MSDSVLLGECLGHFVSNLLNVKGVGWFLKVASSLTIKD